MSLYFWCILLLSVFEWKIAVTTEHVETESVTNIEPSLKTAESEKNSAGDRATVISASTNSKVKQTSTTSSSESSSIKAEEVQKPDPLTLYKHLFRHKRKDHQSAVKRILDIEKYEKQFKLVKMMLDKIFEVLHEAHVNLTEAGYMPGDEFPEHEPTRNHVANVAENTALFGELALRLPDKVHRLYDSNYEWKTQIGWAFLVCESSNLFDGANSEMLHLAAQEIGFREKEDTFINPYRSDTKHEMAMSEEIKKLVKSEKDKAKKKKKRKDRGPRLAGGRIEL